MQPRLEVGILVLQSEGLVRCSRYVRFALQFTPTIIIPEPNQVAFTIGHFSLYTDLVAVEVVGLLAVFAFFIGPVAYLHQPFVGVLVGIDIGIPAVRVDFLR